MAIRWPTITTRFAGRPSSSCRTAAGGSLSAARTTTISSVSTSDTPTQSLSWPAATCEGVCAPKNRSESRLHARRGLDTQEAEAEAQRARREGTQLEPVPPLLGRVGPQHRALLVEG